MRSTAPELHAGTLSRESLRHESDERLVALTRGGSERAFSEIARRYQRQLRAYCSRLVGVERAQDAVQQALLQAFLALRDGAPREIALRPWLYRIAHNCSIDLLRMGSWDYEQLDLESDGVPQPPALLEQKEELRGLVAGMRRLPDAQRQALTLRELEGCSYEEISARLGHTGSGVRQLIFRARSTLRKGAAALLLPFGLVRDRLMGLAPAVETHQVAGMAAVPASSGGGMDTIGAAALAVVVVLGGVAGGMRGSHQDHRRLAATSHAHMGTTAPPLSSSPFAVAPASHVDGRAPRRRTPAGGGADAAAPAARPFGEAVAPVTQQPAAAPPVVPPAPPPADPSPPAALPPSAPTTASGEGTAVEQQVLSPPPAASSPQARPVQPPPERPQAGSPASPPASKSPGTAPAKPKAGSPVQRPPAKPRPPSKPRSPVSQPPAGPKPGSRPGPAVTPGRTPKLPTPPARQKKHGPATAPAAAAR